MTEQPQADWPPRSSAWQLPEGTKRYGSTGQLWQVTSGKWVRVVHIVPTVLPPPPMLDA